MKIFHYKIPKQEKKVILTYKVTGINAHVKYNLTFWVSKYLVKADNLCKLVKNNN